MTEATQRNPLASARGFSGLVNFFPLCMVKCKVWSAGHTNTVFIQPTNRRVN